MNRIASALWILLCLAIIAALWLASGCAPLPPVHPKPTPIPVVEAPPTATPTPEPVVRPLTEGRAVFEVDLSGFAPAPDLDSYAFATLAWVAPVVGLRPTTPALQLGLRGTLAEPCATKPCAGRMAVEVRYSSNLKHDGTPGMPEASMCGQGTRPPQWIPLGSGPLALVAVEWRPGAVVVSTVAGSAVLTQGAATPAFGWWVAGIPVRGVGWSYAEAWTLQAHGGRVRLISWEGVAGGTVGGCP